MVDQESRSIIRLHLGCGRKFLKGFTHIDIDSFPNIEFIAKMDELNMIEDNSVEIIYASHALSYYDRNEVDKVLLEWKRILKPGGTCYVSVPDLDALIEIYKLTGEASKVLGPIYGIWPNELGETFIQHRTIWNKKDMYQKLESLGFVNIREFDAVSFLGAIDNEYDDYSLAYYPHLDRAGIKVSLCISFESRV